MHGGGGMHGGGVCVAGGHMWQGCACWGGEHAWQVACMAGGMHGRGHGWQWGKAAWQERWPLQRAVRILLECILVYHKYCFIQLLLLQLLQSSLSIPFCPLPFYFCDNELWTGSTRRVTSRYSVVFRMTALRFTVKWNTVLPILPKWNSVLCKTELHHPPPPENGITFCSETELFTQNVLLEHHALRHSDFLRMSKNLT